MTSHFMPGYRQEKNTTNQKHEQREEDNRC